MLTDDQLFVLLGEVRNYLDITWQDSEQDKNLRGYIKRGALRINRLCGAASEDFTEEGAAKELLFDYCRYAYNKCLEDFEKNFRGVILELQIYNQVKGKQKNEQSGNV